MTQSLESKLQVLAAQTKHYALVGGGGMLSQAAELLGDQPATGAELGAIVSTAYGKWNNVGGMGPASGVASFMCCLG